MRSAAIVLLPMLMPLAWAQKPVPIRVSVDAAKAGRTMQGGIGASWHAIETPILRGGKIRIPGQVPPGGSAWGANPRADDDAGWAEVFRHADWLGLDWCRVELEQRMYEPERRRFDWNNPEMRILYRILDWAERRGVEVFLQQMWSNVDWNAHPELRGTDRRVNSSPHSMEDFAYGLGELVEHLSKRKGYRSIRWLGITNEPGENWSWWQGPDGKAAPLAPGLAAVRKELDRRGVDVRLAGPDWSGLPEPVPAGYDWEPHIGAYDLHTYGVAFDGMSCGEMQLAGAEYRLWQWSGYSHDRGKPFFLSELGTSLYGTHGRDPGPGIYDSALKDAALVVRGIRAGVDAFNRWSMLNRGDLDGQWQLVDTWDFDTDKLREKFAPHPNSYYLYGLLSRLTAPHSEVLDTKVEGNPEERERSLAAATLRSPDGNLTVLVVNEMYWDADVTVKIAGTGKRTLRRYSVTPAARDRADVVIAPAGAYSESGFSDRVPGLSVVAYSTYSLPHAAPGIAGKPLP
jgi:hypothetical protein